jgi:protein-S-isoprenylcysteine O-methyltransferase Ste14
MDMSLLARWRVRLGYPVAAIFFWLARPTAESIAAGAVVSAVGLLIRAAAAGYLRKHEGLATSGPYAHTRNPLYFGSFFLAAGLLIAGHSWLAAVVVAGFFLAFYPGVMKREEGELREHYGQEYKEYAKRVPLFWPSLRGYIPPPPERNQRGDGRSGIQPGFSCALYMRNREYQASVGFLAVMALLWIVIRLRTPL